MLSTEERPVFRNPGKLQVLSHREWIRNNMPNGKSGLVVEDLDLVMRVYGAGFKTDSDGRFSLIELKYGDAYIGYAQRKTFSMIHALLRKSDPDKKRYRGYYVVQYDNEDWEKASFTVNRIPITKVDFIKFLQCEDAGLLPDFPPQ